MPDESSYRRYPEYKDSGVEWLGEIPEGWGVKRLKHFASVLVSNVDKHSKDTEQDVRLCNYVDVYYKDLLDNGMNFMKATASVNEINKFQLFKGDILVTKDSESWDDIAIPAYVIEKLDNVVCGYHVAIIRTMDYVNEKYIFWAFFSRNLNIQFQLNANGITRFGLSRDSINNAIFVIPPIDTQKVISNFLDTQTATIDKLLGINNRKIELLKEYRKSLISHAVTKGLDPDARMKDSGVEWLGKIPEEWEIKPLKLYFTFAKGKDAQQYTKEYVMMHKGEYPVYSGQTENDGVMGNIDTYDHDYQEVIFVTTVGAKAMTPILLQGRLSLSQNCLIMIPKGNIPSRYFYYQMFPLFQYERASIPSHMQPSLRKGDLNQFEIVAPNSEEQQRIANFLDEKTKTIDSEIQKIEKQNELLTEYRQSLISNAVTGKIMV